jgi:inner membrane protein
METGSMGMKLMMAGGLALAMTVPAIFVEGILRDRTERSAAVTREISAYSGGPQTFLGPTLAIPYRSSIPSGVSTGGVYFVFPVTGSARLTTTTQERSRSLFKVPVFQAGIDFDADFDLSSIPSEISGGTLDWSRAELFVGVSNSRGAQSDATLTAGGKASVLAPAGFASEVVAGSGKDHSIRLTVLGAKTDVSPGSRFHVRSSMRFSGAQRVAVLAYGKTTTVSAQGDWRNPGFDGGFLPVRRSLSPAGFTAEWSVPFVARGVRAEGAGNILAGLESTSLGTTFVEVTDPYQSVSRSLKYALLFVGLVFLAYFAFETATGKRVHPAQYLLVGIAQSLFYLLLLSLAERIGFDWGFLAAGAATVALLSTNAAWVFAAPRFGTCAAAVFSPLYALIYLMLRMEDYALLAGAIASFVAIAGIMYLTRRLNWYGSATEAMAK